MKIRMHTMLGTLHSWSIVSQSLAREFIKLGHQVFLKSTNTLEHFPDDLKPYLLPGYHSPLIQGPADYKTADGQFIKVDPKNPLPEPEDTNRPYDLECIYSIFFQISRARRRFYDDSKLRTIIWNYESSVLPAGWPLYTRDVDYVLPSSQYSYDIFANDGVSKEKMLVVPHGIDHSLFNPDIPPFELKTKKKIKFLHNAIPHARKLHDRVLKGYLDTFTGDDDVCLVMKTKFIDPRPGQKFEVDVRKILEKAFEGRKNPAEVEVITSFIPNIASLYTACDATVSMSSSEGFSLTLLESIACGVPVIAPRHGGQLDFLNDENSLLVDCGEMLADETQQYWSYTPGAVVGDPDVKHFGKLLREFYENPEKEKERVREKALETAKEFTWERAAKMICDLPIPEVSSRVYDKKRVLYIIPYDIVGGGEFWVREAIKTLDRGIYEPHVALVSGNAPARLFEDLSVVVEDLTNQGRVAALKTLVESGGYSIIHFYNSFTVYDILSQAVEQGLRTHIVETVHSELSWPDSMLKVSKRLPFVSAVLSVSKSLGRKIKLAGNKNVFYIPQKINWSKFNVPRSKEILKELNIPSNFVIGYVGRLSPEKNVPVIIKCAELCPNISFVIVGDGPQENALKSLANSLSNVHFLGRRNDVEKFYAAFDVLALPSGMEGLPMVILEAMAVGVPVVATNVGAISELLTESLTGYLLNSPHPKLLADAIIKLTDENNWKRCSDNCRVVADNMRAESEKINIQKVYDILR